MVDPVETGGVEPRCREASRSDDSETDPCSLVGIRQLVVEHYQSVFRYAYRLSGNVDDAEDLAQQAFLVAHRKLYQLREADKADRWLFAILRSCYLKSRRRQRPMAAANLELNVDEIPEGAIQQFRDAGVDEERLQQAIDEMPDKFKLVIMMFYFEQLSYKEIASQLEVRIGTVMSRLARAKGRLRRRLVSFHEAPSALRETDGNAHLPTRSTNAT